MNRFILSCTTFCFLLSSVFGQTAYALADIVRENGAAALPIDGLAIPYAAGRVTDAGYFDSGSVVINIQDLHCHPEVQRNISKILGILDERYGLPRVYLEGGTGSIDTSWVNLIEDDTLRERIVGSLLDSGKLTGPEYYSIQSKRYSLLAGLEDKDTYTANIMRLGEIIEKRGEIEQVLPAAKIRLEALKQAYYTPKNRKLEALLEKHAQNKLAADSYYAQLRDYARKARVRPYDYRTISEFAEINKLRKNLDYKRVSRKLGDFLEGLKKELPYSEYRVLMDKARAASGPDELYVYLAKAVKDYKLNVPGSRGDLGRFLEFIDRNQKINPLELVGEERRLIRALREKFSESGAERETGFLADFFCYLEEYLDNRISADGFEYYEKNKEAFKLLWAKYIDLGRIPGLKPYYELFDAFYRVNVERNEIFVKNIFGNAKRPGEKEVIVVVTGGFHTQGLTALLKERKITYLVITPNVTSDTAFSQAEYDRLAREYANIFSAQTIALPVLSELLSKGSVSEQRLAVVREVLKDEPALFRDNNVPALGNFIAEQFTASLREGTSIDELVAGVREALNPVRDGISFRDFRLVSDRLVYEGDAQRLEFVYDKAAGEVKFVSGKHLKPRTGISARYARARATLERYGQQHLLEDWDILSGRQKRNLLDSIEGQDWEGLLGENGLYPKLVIRKEGSSLAIDPAKTEASQPIVDVSEEALSEGSEILAPGNSEEISEYGIITVAGGRGSRFDPRHAKGIFKGATPLSNQCFYEALIYKNLAAARTHGRAQMYPMVLMVSDQTEKDTIEYLTALFRYLKRHNPEDYAAIKDRLALSVQPVIPAVNEQGKVFRKSIDQISAAASGHGAALDYLLNPKARAAAHKWDDRTGGFKGKDTLNGWLDAFGVKFMHYTNVDNVLTPIADHRLVGQHALGYKTHREAILEEGKAHVTIGVIEKRARAGKEAWQENLGNIVRVTGENGAFTKISVDYGLTPESVKKLCRYGNPSIFIVTRETLGGRMIPNWSVPEKEDMAFEVSGRAKTLRRIPVLGRLVPLSGKMTPVKIRKFEQSSQDKPRSRYSDEVVLSRDEVFSETKDKVQLVESRKLQSSFWRTKIQQAFPEGMPGIENETTIFELPWSAAFLSPAKLRQHLTAINFSSYLSLNQGKGISVESSFRDGEERWKVKVSPNPFINTEHAGSDLLSGLKNFFLKRADNSTVGRLLFTINHPRLSGGIIEQLAGWYYGLRPVFGGKYKVSARSITEEIDGKAVNLTAYRFADPSTNSSFEIVPGYANKVISYVAKGKELLYYSGKITASGGFEWMFPYIDRVDGSEFTVNGRKVSLSDSPLVKPVQESDNEKKHVYHGMVRKLPFTVEKIGADKNGIFIRSSIDTNDHPGISGRFGRAKFTVTYRIKGNKLTSEAEVVNEEKNKEIILSTGFHPWYRRADGSWSAGVAAHRRSVPRSKVNLIPSGDTEPVEPGIVYDFQSPQSDVLINTDALIDGKAFTSWLYNEKDGTYIAFTQENMPFTVKWVPAKDGKLDPFLAIEALSSNVNAINDENNEKGLRPVRIKPGRKYNARVSVAVNTLVDLRGIPFAVKQVGELTPQPPRPETRAASHAQAYSVTAGFGIPQALHRPAISKVAPRLAGSNWVLAGPGNARLFERAKTLYAMGITPFVVMPAPEKGRSASALHLGEISRVVVPTTSGGNILADVWADRVELDRGRSIWVFYGEPLPEEGQEVVKAEFDALLPLAVAQMLNANPRAKEALGLPPRWRLDVFATGSHSESLAGFKMADREMAASVMVYDRSLANTAERMNEAVYDRVVSGQDAVSDLKRIERSLIDKRSLFGPDDAGEFNLESMPAAMKAITSAA